MVSIIQTTDYLIRLRSLVEPAEALEKHGFITRPLTDEDLLLKRRCCGCGKAMSQLNRSRLKPSNPRPQLGSPKETLTTIAQAPLPVSLKEPPPVPAVQQVPKLRCKYHVGTVVEKRWTCCDQPGAAEPCSGAYEHMPQMQTLTELSKLYQFHSTPLVPPKKSDIRPAVAVDCEMGTAVSGDSELIRLTMIDYFSGAVLIDKIVEPDVPMLHLNTKYSGVSWAVFNRARRQGISLKGKGGARRAVWKYVGSNTIVIGHGITNDLRALRWIHTFVADSMIIETGRMKRKEAEAANAEISAQDNLSRSDTTVEGLVQRLTLVNESQGTNISPGQPEENTPRPARVRKPGKLALKTLAKQYLDRDIQTNERKGHDSLEDAIAARDLIHWNVVHPEQ